MLQGKPSGSGQSIAPPSKRTPNSSRGQTGDLMSTIFSVAELAVGAIGLDFTPSKEEMNRLIQLRYDRTNQEKTRLFVFDSDTLDSSREFVQDCRNGVGPSVSGLQGSHLTPVFFLESKGAAGASSFGKEQELNALVDEVVGWIKGKGPSRGPNW